MGSGECEPEEFLTSLAMNQHVTKAHNHEERLYQSDGLV
jgi:hypothetical protein